MTRVLVFATTLILTFTGAFLKADSTDSDEIPYIQTQSNIDLDAMDAQIPVMLRPNNPNNYDFNIFSLVTPTKAQQAPPQSDVTMIRVNIYPVVAGRNSEGFIQATGDPYYRKTVNFGGVTLTSMNGPFHLTMVNGNVIGDGSKLSFQLSNNLAKSTFTLDTRGAVFQPLIVSQEPGAGPRFKPLIVSQEPGAVTRVDWQSSAGPVRFYYEGNFNITLQRTPENLPTVKIVNVIELERYASLVLPNELTPNGTPLSMLEGMATLIRNYALDKMDQGRDPDSDVYASTQDQLYRPQLYKMVPVKDLRTGKVLKDRKTGKAVLEEVASAEDPSVILAASNTVNQIITYGGHIASNTMYSANCGGQSISMLDYSIEMHKPPHRVPYLDTVVEHNVEALRKLTNGNATFTLTTTMLATLLHSAGVPFGDAQVTSVIPANPDTSGRATDLIFHGPMSTSVVPTGSDQFARLKKSLVPYATNKIVWELKPYMDPARASGNSITIKSYGMGPNVGFCQEGGVLMAKAARDHNKDDNQVYIRLLEFYYKGAKVQNRLLPL